MKLFTMLAIISLTGCNLLDECQPGDIEQCKCGINSYVNYCTMDGFYYDCECYQNNGTPITKEQAKKKEQDGGTMTGGDQESVNFWFPDNLPIRTCDSGEIAIPGFNQCWRVCPAGVNWVNGKCQGYAYYSWYEDVLARCQSYRPDYRIVKMEELVQVLNECYPITFSKNTVNYCSPYLKSAIRNVLQLRNGTNFNTWIGKLEECKDSYGFQGDNCAWVANFNTLNKNIPSSFNFLRAKKQVGNALAGGVCVRE